MAKLPTPDYILYLEESLEPLGGIHSKRMFGGFGIFKDGLMIGLVADEVLYLKVDATNKPEFQAHDLEPFTYTRDGKPFAMSYHRAPTEALENPELLQKWATSAYAAAVRAKK